VNFGRVAASALMAWLAHIGLTSLVWGDLLPNVFAGTLSMLRAPGERPLALGHSASLLGFFVFAYAFAKGYEGGVGAAEGLRFGVIVGLLLACFSGVWGYVMMPVSAGFALAMVVDAIVEMAICGVVVGFIYTPHAGRK